jgi:hypothetical protein
VHLYAAWLSDKAYRWADAMAHCQAALAADPQCGTAALQIGAALTQAGSKATGASTAGSTEAWLNRAEAGRRFLPGTYQHVLEERGGLRLRQGLLAPAVDNLWAALHYAPLTPFYGTASVTLAKALRRLQAQGRAGVGH